jgi:hypothetical protein
METNEQVMITLGKMLKMETEAATGVYSKATGLISQMRGSGTLFSKNVDIFKMIEQAVADPEVALPGFLDALQPSMTRMVDKFTDTKRIIQQEMLSQLEAHYSNYSTLMGGLSKEQFESVGEINTLNALRRKWKAIHGLDGSTVEEATKNKMETLEDFIGSISSPTEKQQIFHDNLEKAVKKYSPWYGYGPGEKPSNAFGDTPYIVMNKIRHPIKEINEVIKAGGSFKDVMQRISDTTIGQMGFDFGFGFRAGRKNLDKVTTLTAGTYYYFDRLNEGIARMGLGLSQKSLGSAQDIFGNLVLKRYGLAVGGIMALKYLDYQAEKATGSEPSEVAGKAYVNMTRDVAKVKDVSGITDLNKMLHRMFPGSEKLFQNPLGGAIKYGTLGLIGDDRSADELNEYWANGTDAIRKGRWWGIGSNTPWYGGKIDHFAPNWYRRAVSDYKYTDVMYGSKDEYWANQWVPTPMHPLAPLHKIFDPNHWANKHREDRPYPVVGGVSELNEVPIIGPVLNGTVGQILNPMYKRGDLAKAHRQYIQDINDSIRQGEVSSPGYLYITPAGGTQTVALSGDSWGEDAAVGEMGYATPPEWRKQHTNGKCSTGICSNAIR